MPMLSSGRHVAIDMVSFSKHLNSIENYSTLYFLIIEYRLKVSHPSDLLQFLPVLYFENNCIEPPCTRYSSGYTVTDVLSSNADWTDLEVLEFKEWVSGNDRLDEYLKSEYESLDQSIKAHPIWDSEYMSDVIYCNPPEDES